MVSKALIAFMCLFVAVTIVAFTVGIELTTEHPNRQRALRLMKTCANGSPDRMMFYMRGLDLYEATGALLPFDTVIADDSLAMMTIAENGGIGWQRIGDGFREGEGIPVRWVTDSLEVAKLRDTPTGGNR